jgi:hypothetical protein
MFRSVCMSLVALSLALPAVAQGLGNDLQAARAPMSKAMVETPLKRAINPGYMRPVTSSVRSPKPTKLPSTVMPETSLGKDANGVEKVMPGLVGWHKDMSKAREASGASGKPILMFAMVGNLDDKFC